jgi:NAD(P)-dependent dehydrogenase (short-subunit alcohol dehydrogenase family)
VNRSSREDFNHFLKQMKKQIAGVVLIAPRPQFYGKSLLQDEDVWLEVFQNTFTGPAEALKVILPYLSSASKVVIIAGTSSVQLQSEHGPACVIRRMWTTYAKALSHQLGPKGVSVNVLSPGVVLTHFHEERIHKTADENQLSYEDQMKKEVANIPLQRHAKPLEVAQTIRFLLSEQSDFINGVNLIFDGGFTSSYQ